MFDKCNLVADKKTFEMIVLSIEVNIKNFPLPLSIVSDSVITELNSKGFVCDWLTVRQVAKVMVSEGVIKGIGYLNNNNKKCLLLMNNNQSVVI